VQGAAEPFYSTPEEGVEFVLEGGHFCRAVGTAVASMKKEEEARLVVNPECECLRLFLPPKPWFGFGKGTAASTERHLKETSTRPRAALQGC
jgi:hypothetical protein